MAPKRESSPTRLVFSKRPVRLLCAPRPRRRCWFLSSLSFGSAIVRAYHTGPRLRTLHRGAIPRYSFGAFRPILKGPLTED